MSGVEESQGAALDKAGVYPVLANDFMFAGGDSYGCLAQYDPQSYNTGIDLPQPVIDWIIEQDSNPQRPLDEAIGRLVD